jgi:hypothetical protein
MFFYYDLVTCDDFDDCHDKITFVGVDHRQGANLWPLSAKEGVLLGTPNENNYSGSSISSSIFMGRKMHPMLHPMIQVSMFFHQFIYVLY